MDKIPPETRLLVVDDCAVNLTLMRSILNRLGFTSIETVLDSRETVARVQLFQPDLIMLDLNMPLLSGFGVMQRLGEVISPGTYLPVLILTADATAATRRKVLAAGASDLLTKPFKSPELFARIQSLLQRRVPNHYPNLGQFGDTSG